MVLATSQSRAPTSSCLPSGISKRAAASRSLWCFCHYFICIAASDLASRSCEISVSRFWQSSPKRSSSFSLQLRLVMMSWTRGYSPRRLRGSLRVGWVAVAREESLGKPDAAPRLHGRTPSEQYVSCGDLLHAAPRTVHSRCFFKSIEANYYYSRMEEKRPHPCDGARSKILFTWAYSSTT